MNVSIQSMSTSAPALLPLFRSDNQLRLLAKVLLAPLRSWTITELAVATGVPQPSVSREVARLIDAGLFVGHVRPGAREFRANVESAIYPELHGMLLKTVGPKSVLEDALRGVPNIKQAKIYGSWARRYHGEKGLEPQDIDLLVVGSPDVDTVTAVAEQASQALGRDVNPTILTEDEYEAEPSEFVKAIKISNAVNLEVDQVNQ